MEMFRVTSRIVTSGAERSGDGTQGARPSHGELGTRLRAALLRRGAEEFGPRWRGPLHAEGDDKDFPSPLPADFYDGIVTGPDRLVILSTTHSDGASQAIRAALYRAPEPGADFPPVLMTPDAETVRAGALHAALRQLSERPVSVYAIDLLGVSGSAMPEALRAVTAAIARDGHSAHPARWILLLDPLYETRIRRWSDPEFFGSMRIAHASPIDGISMEIDVETGSIELIVSVFGVLASLFAGISGRGAFRSGLDWIGKDMATVQRILSGAIESFRDGALVEMERTVKMHPRAQRLVRLIVDCELGEIGKDEFVDRTLQALAEMRREAPDEAIPVAEFVAAYADSHMLEPVPVPDDAMFVETIGPAPAVQRIRRPERDHEPEGV